MSKYCQNCGKEIPEDSAFCENCGKNVNEEPVEYRELEKGEKRCKTCDKIYDKKLKFCPNCGAHTRQITPAKLKSCKKCGHLIAESTNICPNCGKETYVALKGIVTVLSIILVIILFFVVVLSIGDDTQDTANTDTSNETISTSKKTLLYSDSYFDIEYLKFYEVSEISTSYLQLKIKNKSDKKLTLSLDDVYVNDILVQSGSGLPIELKKGKTSTSPFILFTANTGLTENDVTKIEFKLKAYDESFNKIHSTKKITIKR